VGEQGNGQQPARCLHLQDAALFAAVIDAHLVTARPPPVLPLAPPAAGAGGC
jgi:hypothetical protein